MLTTETIQSVIGSLIMVLESGIQFGPTDSAAARDNARFIERYARERAHGDANLLGIAQNELSSAQAYDSIHHVLKKHVEELMTLSNQAGQADVIARLRTFVQELTPLAEKAKTYASIMKKDAEYFQQYQRVRAPRDMPLKSIVDHTVQACQDTGGMFAESIQDHIEMLNKLISDLSKGD